MPAGGTTEREALVVFRTYCRDDHRSDKLRGGDAILGGRSSSLLPLPVLCLWQTTCIQVCLSSQHRCSPTAQFPPVISNLRKYLWQYCRPLPIYGSIWVNVFYWCIVWQSIIFLIDQLYNITICSCPYWRLVHTRVTVCTTAGYRVVLSNTSSQPSMQGYVRAKYYLNSRLAYKIQKQNWQLTFFAK